MKAEPCENFQYERRGWKRGADSPSKCPKPNILSVLLLLEDVVESDLRFVPHGHRSGDSGRKSVGRVNTVLQGEKRVEVSGPENFDRPTRWCEVKIYFECGVGLPG